MPWYKSVMFQKIVFLSFLSTIISQNCYRDECEKLKLESKNCKYFDPNQFNEESPSIMYGKT